METTTATALATTAITTSELNTVAEDVQFEDINVTTAPSVTFLEANTSAISIEELTVNCVVPTWANQELTISHQDFINTVHDAACNVFSGELITRVRDNVGQIGNIIVTHESSGNPTGSPDFFNRCDLFPEDELTVVLWQLVIEIDSRLCVEEAVCPHCSKQVHDEIVDTPVTRMHKLGHVLEHIVY